MLLLYELIWKEKRLVLKAEMDDSDEAETKKVDETAHTTPHS